MDNLDSGFLEQSQPKYDFLNNVVYYGYLNVWAKLEGAVYFKFFEQTGHPPHYPHPHHKNAISSEILYKK